MSDKQYDNSNRGALFRNYHKEKDSHPDFRGEGNFNGVTFAISGWFKETRKGKILSLAFKEPYKREERQSGGEDDAWDGF